jgi:hypothetical protein
MTIFFCLTATVLAQPFRFLGKLLLAFASTVILGSRP